MFRKAKAFIRVTREFGITRALKYSLAWALTHVVNSTHHDYLHRPVYDKSLAEVSSHSKEIYDQTAPLVWFVPSWSNVWGGGHFTIFRFAHQFSAHRQNIIYVYNNEGRYSAQYFLDSLNSAFGTHNLRVVINPAELPQNSIPLATTWQSVYAVLEHCPKALFKFYFMQDYENLFYAHGSESMQAIASYQQGLIGITGGPWLLSKFREHGGDGINYMFTVEHEVFFPISKEDTSIKRIFFYGRPSTERRCFELGIAALKLIKERYPHIEIVIAGLDGIGKVGFEATMAGSVALPKLGELYRSCDLGIALSGTNLSYLPVELMACGIPVITNNGPQVEWFCEDGVDALVVEPFPASILEAVDKLITSPELRSRLIHNGITKTAESNWENEGNKIHRFIESFISGSKITP